MGRKSLQQKNVVENYSTLFTESCRPSFPVINPVALQNAATGPVLFGLAHSGFPVLLPVFSARLDLPQGPSFPHILCFLLVHSVRQITTPSCFGPVTALHCQSSHPHSTLCCTRMLFLRRQSFDFPSVHLGTPSERICRR
jgi:hypothetical protein